MTCQAEKSFFFLGRRQLVFQLSGFPTFLISESHLGQKTGWVPLVPLRFVGSSNIWNIWIPPFPVLLVRRWYIAQGYTGWGFQQTIRAFPHILSCGIYLSIYRYTQYLFIYLARYTQYLFITIVRYHSLLEFVKRKDHCVLLLLSLLLLLLLIVHHCNHYHRSSDQ